MHQNDLPVEELTTILDRFEGQVARRPDHIALVGPTRTLTFQEVDGLAGRAAGALLDRHGPGSAPVALIFDHDIDLVVALLAVMKSGRPVVVLDPEAPAEVTSAVVTDAEPMAIVCDRANREGRPDGEATLHLWDDLRSTSAPGRADVGPDDIAMLAYTSGTTGRAKGAIIPHRTLAKVMDGATTALSIDEHDHLPMLFPVSLAVAAYPMLLPLVNGGVLHTFDMRALGLAPFPAWLAEHQISVIYFSPTVARFMEGVEDLPFPALRTVVLGGERVDDDAVGVVREVFGSAVEIFNGYGTTETGVLTFHRVAPGVRYGAQGVPAGTPIEGMDLSFVGSDGVAVPDGEIGDLVVRGRNLFDGYWGRPDLDEQVLSIDPDDGVAVYRTGDLGRWSGEEVELVGRSDTEVKIRGHRVLPGEVEQGLLALEEVVDAVVDTRLDAYGSNELIAWVVPAPGADGQLVRQAFSVVAKSHLVPATVLAVDELPLLPNGKLDRQSLPEPANDRPEGLGVAEPCRTDDERMLLDTWEQIFSIRPIGVFDDFESLGGQSLDAARMLIVLEERHGIRLPMASMLEARTIADLAIRVSELSATPADRPSSITVITAESTERPTLYFVHDLHGSAYSLRYLAPLLGSDQPLAGFESPLLDGQRTPFSRLETLALRYVTDLQRHQPSGPYHLAGYSFGGVLAFEIARQLVAAGEEVPFLGIFDVGPGYRGRHFHPRRPPQKPTLLIPMVPEGLDRSERLRWYADLARREPTGLVDNLLVRTRADRLTDYLREERDLRGRGDIHPARRLWYAWRTHWELARTYSWEDKSYAGPLTLFWADETGSTDATMGWGDVVDGRLDIIRVSIEHETFLQESGVEGIAAALRQELDRSVLEAKEQPDGP